MSLGYPSVQDETAMVLNRLNGNPMTQLEPLMSRENLIAMQDEVAKTYVNETVVRYIVALIDATRNHSQILRGASPRATLSVTAVARAVAQLRGRDYVTPRDVQEVFLRIIGHRLLLSPRAEAENVNVQNILREILEAVPAPVLR
jgi:MoxR-like ATPase